MAAVRWYELRGLLGGSPSIFQQGTFAGVSPDTKNRWMGSAAMDGAGNIGLGYSVSDAVATFPSVEYTGRLVTDTLGTMPQGEGVFQAGAGSQSDPTDPTDNRWGDYSTLDIDPIDNCTFWYTNEYYKATSPRNWSTRIGSFRFPNCQTSSVAVARFGSHRIARTGVTATWRTRSELDVLGFDLYRNGVKLNARLIPARHSGEATGAAYRFVDRLAPRLHEPTYRLQVVSLRGSRSWFAVGSSPA